jgi:hypothetical protein
MPAKSKSQQQAAGAALAAKRGEVRKSELRGASRSMYESMSAGQLKEFASTKLKGKPDKVSKSKSKSRPRSASSGSGTRSRTSGARSRSKARSR